MKTLLIVYATWTGATRTVAEAIAAELQGSEVQVDVSRAGKVKDISRYQAVIALASVHMGQLPGEIKRFVRAQRRSLAAQPLAYGIVCLATAEATEESRAATQGYVDKILAIAPELKPAVEVKLFGGAVLTDTPEFKRLFPLLKTPVRALAQKPDHRDWEDIRGWAKQLQPKLIAGAMA